MDMLVGETVDKEVRDTEAAERSLVTCRMIVWRQGIQRTKKYSGSPDWQLACKIDSEW